MEKVGIINKKFRGNPVCKGCYLQRPGCESKDIAIRDCKDICSPTEKTAQTYWEQRRLWLGKVSRGLRGPGAKLGMPLASCWKQRRGLWHPLCLGGLCISVRRDWVQEMWWKLPQGWLCLEMVLTWSAECGQQMQHCWCWFGEKDNWRNRSRVLGAGAAE